MNLIVNKNAPHPYVDLTPYFFKQMYRDYLKGNYRKLIALFERVEDDSFVGGCLLHRNAGYKREWTLEPASSSAQDKMIAEKLTDLLKFYNLRDLFDDIISSKHKKYSVIAFDDWAIINNLQAPTGFTIKHQRYFRFDRDDNNILKVDLGLNKLVNIEEDHALVCVNNKQPTLLPVSKDYIRMNFGRDRWSAFIENFGEDIIDLAYPSGDANKKTEAEKALKGIGSSTRLVHGDDMELGITGSNRRTGDHNLYVNNSKENISFRILGHAEAAGGGNRKAQIGDNQTTLKVSEKIAIADMYYIEEKIKPLLSLLVKKNWGTSNIPRLVIDKSTKLDPNIILKAADQAYDQGAAVDPKVYKNLGVVMPDDQKPLQKESFPD